MNNKLYLIEGLNDVLIQKEIDKIILDNKNDEVEVIRYDLTENLIDIVIEDLDTYDMFLKQKIVICTNPVFLQEKDENFNTLKFEKYIKNPSDNILIIVTNKLNNRLKITNLVNEYFKLIKIKEISYDNFVKENIKGYKMDSLTIKYFLNKVGKDYNMILQELIKLKNYKLDTKVITNSDIDLITNQNIEASIFDLIDAIIKKDKVKSYELYNHFINNGTEVFQILILLSNQIRLIYNVKVLSHLSDFEISNKLGVKEYPVKLARTKGFSYKKGELLNLLYDLSIIDEDIKSGKQLIDISLLTFVMQM